MNKKTAPNELCPCSSGKKFSECHGESTESSAGEWAAPAVPAPLESAPRIRKRRGFAAMDPKRVSEIASKGGKAAHRAGTAHEFTSAEARVAGRKGGAAAYAAKRARREK